MSIEKVFWTFNPLEGKNIPDQYKAEALDIAANFIKEQILEYVADGKSPVEGESFPKLSKEYAEDEKMGDRTPNLDKTGAMMDAFDVVVEDGRLVLRVEGEQAPKAEGHNQLDPSLAHPLPRRRFIPDKDQTLKREILDGLNDVLAGLSEPNDGGPDDPNSQDEPRVIRITEEIAARLFGFSLFDNVRLRRAS